MCKSFCEAFHEFMSAQRDELKKEIELNKWFMSQKAGQDVGWTKAEMDYLETHFPGFRKRFRKEFCLKCTEKDCPSREKFLSE